MGARCRAVMNGRLVRLVEVVMDAELRAVVLEIMECHRIMTVATLRADGFPQATTVSYVYDGLDLYFGCAPMSQKARNIDRDPRVSLTIDHDYHDLNRIRGISAGGLAEPLSRLEDRAKVERLMLRRFPEMQHYAPDVTDEDVLFIRVRPTVISVIDYTKGFGHTDLVVLS
jgi:nitroimidazol reductase NimA-like FMN-containing flavoprotein (pyridoxamine 5'-phosphate oxidase superfamily)